MIRSTPARPRTITLGTGFDDGEPVRLELESLRKHTAIFAGSGSGKTVLIRRLIEECALQGVSTIVLDPNNDLARLGDAVARAAGALGRRRRGAGGGVPRAHRRGGLDAAAGVGATAELPAAARLREHRATTRRVRRRRSTRPWPRSRRGRRSTARTAKAQLGQAVLREALRHYARSGGERPAGVRRHAQPSCRTGVSQLDDAREDRRSSSART